MSRTTFLGSAFSTVTCAPVYSLRHGLSRPVRVGSEEGLEYDKAIHCDELVSLPHPALTDHVGDLSESWLHDLNRALAIALELS